MTRFARDLITGPGQADMGILTRFARWSALRPALQVATFGGMVAAVVAVS